MKNPKLTLPVVLVHQEAEENWARLDQDDIELLKRQIREELKAPDVGVIVLPPGCTLDIVTDVLDSNQILISGIPNGEDADEDDLDDEDDGDDPDEFAPVQ